LGENDKKAGFLDAVRALDPDNEILRRLDSAQSMPELMARMGDTMFFNPLVLNDGLRKISLGIRAGF
jgi:hypothetical protein